ncbi:MAG: DNA primase [Bacteroidales bacterium]|nr:DNA primase [Bacteroidales bacterium]
MIDQSSIDKVFETAEIVDVVQDFVTLRKRGVNYLGLCPFHNEKTPSFTVSPAKGIYKCFGCGKGGNAVNFIMEHENLSFYEAIKYLAAKYHIELIETQLSEEDQKQKDERESLLTVTEFANKYFQRILHNDDEGKAIGLSYFKERGFTETIIKKFELGYSPEKRDAFTAEALKSSYRLDYLVNAGLTIQKEDYKFDRFHGRVMFPIHALSGKVIGFGGRILKTDAKTAKYLNSPESEIYHKSKVLYGMYFAKKTIVQNDKCYLVEGYTDVLSLVQAGIENVLASSGTALTEDQIRLIKRFTNNITIIYDGDAAGIKASLRGIDLVLEAGMNVRIILLPDGEDPDSFSKSMGASELENYLHENEQDFITFKSNLLLKGTEKDPVKKAEVIQDIVRSISVIPDSITRTLYARECSSLLKVDEKILFTEVSQNRRKKAEDKVKKEHYHEEVKPKKTISKQSFTSALDTEAQEREIIRILLHYGNNELFKLMNEETEEEETVNVSTFIVNEILNDELELTNPLYKQIFEEVADFLHQGQSPPEKYFTHHPDPNISKLSADLLSTSYNLSKIWKKHDNYVETEEMILKILVPEIVIAFKNKKIMQTLLELQEQMKTAQKEENLELIEDIQQRFIMLNDLKQSFAKNLGERIIL